MGVPDKIFPDKFIQKAFYWGPLFAGVVSLVAGAVLVRLDLDFKTRGNSWVIEDRVMVADKPAARPTPDSASLSPRELSADKTADMALPTGPESKARGDDNLARKDETAVQEKVEVARRMAALAARQRDETARRERKQREVARRRKDEARRQAEAQRAATKMKAAEARRLAVAAARLAAEKRAAEKKAELERKILLGASERVGQRAGVEASFSTHAVARTLRLMQPIVRRALARSSGAVVGDAGLQRAALLTPGARLAAERSLKFRAVAIAEEIGRQGMLAYNDDFGLGEMVDGFSARMFGLSAALGAPDAQQGTALVLKGGNRLQLAYLSASLGASPLLTMAGLANSLESASFLKRKNRMWVLGERLSQQQVQFGQAGISLLAKRVRPALHVKNLMGGSDAEGETVGTVARAELAAAFGPLGKPLSDDDAFAGMSCSERFYAAMQRVKLQRVSGIQKVIKPITSLDKSLPGKWTFSMGRARKKSVCVRYKRYYSGRRRCIKRAVRYSRPSGGEFLSEREETFVNTARKLVAGKGRDPMVKPRSPSYWVINRVATDLGRFIGQPLHPAICTGVPRMVDYFDDNLTRIKSHVGSVRELAQSGDALLAARIRQLEESFIARNVSDPMDELKPRIRWQGSPATRELLAAPGATSLQVLMRLTEAVFGFGPARNLEIENGFIPALQQVRRLFKSERHRFEPVSETAFAGTMAVLEARFYMNRADRLYQKLALRLFGSLDVLRAAYQRHCTCEAPMQEPVAPLPIRKTKG